VGEGLPLLLQDGAESYVYGEGGLPLEQIDGAGNVTYLHHDQLGSTRLLTDASGNVTGTYSFDAYGVITGRTGTTRTNLLYAGQYRDGESGLYYLRARYYDPTTAQFLTRDPAVTSTRQPYTYALDNALNYSDATGLCGLMPWDWGDCQDIRGGISGFFGGAADWVSHNFGTAATILAAGGCVVFTVGWCAAFVGGALIIRSAQRWLYEGGSSSIGSDLLDLAMTVAGFGMAGIPGSIGTGDAPEWLAAMLGISPADLEAVESLYGSQAWMEWLAKALLAGPDAVDIATDFLREFAVCKK
jgi:RHS repeat-associated protein